MHHGRLSTKAKKLAHARSCMKACPIQKAVLMDGLFHENRLKQLLHEIGGGGAARPSS